MYTTIVLIPLLASAFAGLYGRKLGVTGAQWLTTLSVMFSAVLSYIAYYEVAMLNNTVYINLGDWVTLGIAQVQWGLLFDSITVSMLIVVRTISGLVHLFSIDYMAHDPHCQRFFSYLSLFTGSMLVLVVGDNYMLRFVGWEMIGISSYLLIGFWFTRIAASKSALKAMIINRVGDIGYTLGVVILYFAIGTWDIGVASTLTNGVDSTVITVVGLLLLLAAMGKSAQFGLHTWLPDAMNGPTPVSALIHSATLVTAGVYLLIRSSSILEYSTTVQRCVRFVGATTAFFAASTGLVQNDLKTVIAYSTCSQLGYMFIAVGLSQYNVALFHLATHGYFKAMLFLSAGAVIHASADEQDMRKLGGLLGFLPFTYSAMIVASLSLIAMPFMSGYYSKDRILELAYGQFTFSASYAYYLGTITAGLTAFYSMRLLSMTFLTVPNASRRLYNTAHDAPTIVMIPLTVLAVLAIFFGYFMSDLYVGLGSQGLINTVLIHPNNITHVEAEFGLNTLNKLLPLFLTLGGAGLSLWVYHYQYDLLSSIVNLRSVRTIHRYLTHKWYVDVVYNHYLANSTLNLGYNMSKILDRGLVEQIGPFGLSTALINSSKSLSRLDTGNLTDYALYIGVSIVLISTSLMLTVYNDFLSVDLLGIILSLSVLVIWSTRRSESLSFTLISITQN